VTTKATDHQMAASRWPAASPSTARESRYGGNTKPTIQALPSTAPRAALRRCCSTSHARYDHGPRDGGAMCTLSAKLVMRNPSTGPRNADGPA